MPVKDEEQDTSQLVSEFRDLTAGESQQRRGKRVDVHHTTVGRWFEKLDAGEPVVLQPSTRERMEREVQALQASVGDPETAAFKRGMRHVIDQVESVLEEAREFMEGLEGAPPDSLERADSIVHEETPELGKRGETG